jgi:hypothetical protein
VRGYASSNLIQCLDCFALNYKGRKTELEKKTPFNKKTSPESTDGLY